MSQGIRWAALLIGLFAWASPTEAQKPKPGGKGTSATPQEYQQVIANGEISGKIARIDHTRRIITVALEIPTIQQGNNGNQNNNLQQLARQQQQMARQMMQRPNQNQNPLQQAQQMQQRAAQMQRQQVQALARNQGNGPKVQTVKKEFEFQADEKAKVRQMNLPQEYDERGKAKQYTAAELKTLKGPNASLPGYQADFENLSAGQTVKLYVTSSKKSPATSPAAAGKPKDVDKDVDRDVMVALDPAKYRATMVLILKDDGGLAGGKPNPKKK